MTRKQKYTDDQIAQAQKMCDSGMPTVKVAQLLGINYGTLRHRLDQRQKRMDKKANGTALSRGQRRALQALEEARHSDFRVVRWDSVNEGPVIRKDNYEYVIPRDGAMFRV